MASVTDNKIAEATTATTAVITLTQTSGGLVVLWARNGLPSETLSISDTKGESWHEFFPQTTGDFGGALQGFYAWGVQAGSNVITCTSTAPADVKLAGINVSGDASFSVDPKDQVVSAKPSFIATFDSGSTAALAQANEFVTCALMGVVGGVPPFWVPGSGYVKLDESSTAILVDEYKIVASTTAVNGTFTDGSSEGGVIAVGTFKLPSAVSATKVGSMLTMFQ